MTTLKDIGDELGLSAATVSRALNGFPEVSARTRQLVQAAAARLNYRPNRIAQKLVTGRSGMVGMVVQVRADMSADPIFFRIVMGLSAALARRDVDLVLTVDPGDDPVAPYRRMVEKNTLDGFILNAPVPDDPRAAFLRGQGVPFVMHGRIPGDDSYPFFDIDNRRAAADPVSLLADLGHRRIALLNGEARLAFSQARLRGYREELASRGLTAPDGYVVHDLPGRNTAYTQTLALLSGRLGPPPTAFVCASTVIARGACRAIADKGLNIPGDVCVVAHDDGLPDHRAEEFDPPLTVTRAPLTDACAPLAAALLDHIDGKAADALQIEVQAHLILRRSTGPAPGYPPARLP